MNCFKIPILITLTFDFQTRMMILQMGAWNGSISEQMNVFPANGSHENRIVF